MFRSILFAAYGMGLSQGAAVQRYARDTTDPYADWPSYAELPLDPSYPTKAAWGVWGDNDTQGALNHITPATITRAALEVKSGLAFPLDLELSFIPRPINPERRMLVHEFQPGEGYTDDVVTLNTQQSTQFDGLRHFAYSTDNNASTYQYYNNLIPDYQHVIGYDYTDVLGLQQAAEKGIAARGVLLDYKGWMDSNNVSYDALATHPISVADLDKVASWQGLTGNWTLPGDILLVRTGWISDFSLLNNTQKQELIFGSGNFTGLIANDDTAEWLWSKKLAMVGADNPAFEQTPLGGPIAGDQRALHEIFIAGWGQSILEFLNLEALAEALHEAQRSTFFLTVQTLNVRGGIASPPNAMAII